MMRLALSFGSLALPMVELARNVRMVVLGFAAAPRFQNVVSAI
jgi:hypothetical protein